MLGNFKAHPGLRACLRKGKWRRKGNRKGETLWSLLFNIFNEFLGAEPFHDNADIALGGMVLAHGTANTADQLLGWRTRGGGFPDLLHSRWDYDEPEIFRSSKHQYGPIGADAGQSTAWISGLAALTCG